MFRFLRVVVAVLITSLPLAAQEGDYLTSPEKFTVAWEKLTAEMGTAIDVAEVTITPNEIMVLARAAAGGPRVDRWAIGPLNLLVTEVEAVSGPDPVNPSGPVGDVEASFFPLASVPLDRFGTIADHALAQVILLDPGRVSRASIARQVSLIPRPAYGDPRWLIAITNGRESATVHTTPDGGVTSMDISQTNRGKNQNFLKQADWPFAMAQTTFQTLMGTTPIVYEVDVTRTRISVEAVSVHDAKSLATFFWTGSGFFESNLVMTNTNLIHGDGNLPFAIGDIDLAQVPAIMNAARQASGIASPRIEHANAVKRRLPSGENAVHWDIEMSDADKPVPLGVQGERTTVRITPDAQIIQVILPESRRPRIEPLGGAAIVETLGKFSTALGADTPVLQVQFREDWASVKGFSAQDASMTLEIKLSNEEFRNGMPFPVMMETQNDLFPLSVLSDLDAASLDAITAQAVAAMGIPGAKVHRVTATSGAPFWPSPDGSPRLDIRVGVPPQFNTGGYVMFALDGTLLEVVK